MRELIFAVLLAAAGALIVLGFFDMYRPAGFVSAGVLLGGWSWLVLADEAPAGAPEAA